MENSCRKKYKPSPKKWILASRCDGLRRNSALIPANAGLFHYAGNCPVRYIDPMGMWIDNHDGTYTAESGNTLYDLYGDEWKEKSGFTRDPRTLQIGEIVGKKNIISPKFNF